VNNLWIHENNINHFMDFPVTIGLHGANPVSDRLEQGWRGHPVAIGSVMSEETREAVRSGLVAALPSLLRDWYPHGRIAGKRFLVGNLDGDPGDSLEVVLHGEKAGLWLDRATGEGGDIFDLAGHRLGIDPKTDFPTLLSRCAVLAGVTEARKPNGKARSSASASDPNFGEPTASWDYLSPSGDILVTVYRFDPPGKRKQYRPWLPRERRWGSPQPPRPLYNLPGVAKADTVVVVEGEKCAQALIDLGICATTAMHGAGQPAEKTDWSPLSGKKVLIWPDNDPPGRHYATTVAVASRAAGAQSVDMLVIPEGKPDGWDAADAVGEGFDVAAFLAKGPRVSMDGTPPPPDSKPMQLESGGPVKAGGDDAKALAFVDRFGGDWRYCAEGLGWLFWDRTRWCQDKTLLVFDLVRCMLREGGSVKRRHVSDVEWLARIDRRVATRADEWDRDPFVLNTPEGAIDLSGSGRVSAHDRHAMVTKIAGAAPGGECPLWLRFLDEVTGSDPDLQAYLQRVVGYCLTGSTQEHALFFLYGTGSNGKSVFVNTLLKLLGDYALSASAEMFMLSRHERHPTELARLRGARLVVVPETEQGTRWAEAKIKSITGGDPIAARFMRQDFFVFTPQFKLMVVGNHKPGLRNVDEAIRRRLHLIPFRITIPPERRDPDLAQKLWAERSGIMAWAIRGCDEWRAKGLAPPPIVRDATNSYLQEEDVISEFLESDHVVISNNATVAIADLFQRWQQWASSRGEWVGNARWLAQQLDARGYGRTRMHGGTRGISGIGLVPIERVPGWGQDHPF
jgi:putative DNA primase/helicase